MFYQDQARTLFHTNSDDQNHVRPTVRLQFCHSVFFVFVLFIFFCGIISQYYIIKRMLYSKHDSSVSHCTGGVEEKICEREDM